ncbi:MAG: EFR1 family ferrodoxin [Treponemataceae bacterium]
MVLYFTGTGNSKYIAKKIAEHISDSLISINDKIKVQDTSDILVDGKLIFVLPTYSWRIPRIVENWIRKVKFINAKETYFVMNCGSEIGNAKKYNKLLCDDMGFKYFGTACIVMPENYIAMFKVPDKAEAKAIILKAQNNIEDTIKHIKQGEKLPVPNGFFYDCVLSGFVSKIFYPVFVKSKAFYANTKCISCKQCEKRCPLNNIKIINGKPQWGKNCTHCMACISYCPTEAIEYGKKSRGKPRYTAEKVISDC